MNDFEKIKSIEEEISQYYEMIFDNEADDYNYNKKLKNKLKDIIIDSKNNATIIEKALFILADSTGCAEDQEIAEDIIEYLFSNSFITQDQMNIFYDNLGTTRWM